MMDRPDYSIVVEKLPASEGGGYIAIVPDLPGCMSDGETDVEALLNANDAIDQWVERARAMGRGLPEPVRMRARA
jgi:predicted RNase H-like HicB family nuclease